MKCTENENEMKWKCTPNTNALKSKIYWKQKCTGNDNQLKNVFEHANANALRMQMNWNAIQWKLKQILI